jgi:hypothetical protein
MAVTIGWDIAKAVFEMHGRYAVDLVLGGAKSQPIANLEFAGGALKVGPCTTSPMRLKRMISSAATGSSTIPTPISII